ncbi:heme utilization cystosolic carrier protein HutX [Breoghania sp.]|uniref:heme utilization cystosolic carrier protein HutX n=1 Tax=Breoghania sp. TaxID=2065378 RepID=UPI002AAC14AF|nr:heme utilization cystosolic carrier protein HutX [Breoghania sp.]
MFAIPSELQAHIRTRLAEDPGAVIDHVARDLGTTPAAVIRCLPPEEARVVDGGLFEDVMLACAEWGEMTMIVHTDDVILEAKGCIPRGKKAHGHYNLHGAPIGGHFKYENCAMIAFVSRKLFTSDTRSIQFFNKDGGCMFKIYLGRDEQRNLRSDQVAHFEALRDRLADAG